MAVVISNFVKRGKVGNRRIKATIRYIENRSGRDGAKITRILFGNDGAMTRHQSYQMIDEAEKGSIFFRIVITPDPNGEDKPKDLNLRDITDQTMQQIERQIKQQVAWVAAEHSDHAPHRHVHAVAIVRGKLFTPDLEAIRQRATDAALFQRKERDLAREQQARELEEVQWEL